MIEANHPVLSVRRQCELVGLNRATFYHQPNGETPLNLRLMRLIDEAYTRTPFYGYRKMTAHLNAQGYRVNRKRVARLMRTMGLHAVYPHPRTSLADCEHKKYSYRACSSPRTASPANWKPPTSASAWMVVAAPLTISLSSASGAASNEDLYINEYPTVPALETGRHDYFQLYNYERPPQSLADRTPATVHFAGQAACP